MPLPQQIEAQGALVPCSERSHALLQVRQQGSTPLASELERCKFACLLVRAARQGELLRAGPHCDTINVWVLLCGAGSRVLVAWLGLLVGGFNARLIALCHGVVAV